MTVEASEKPIKVDVREPLANVIHLVFEKQREMAQTMLRPSEYYESPKFKGKIFTVDDFVKWYMHKSVSGQKTNKFTYYDDWDGFSMTMDAFEPFYTGKFDPLSGKEQQLLNIPKIKEKRKKKAYVIATTKDVASSTMKHELGHGLFNTNDDYRSEILEVLEQMKPEDKQAVEGYLKISSGYHPELYTDETHAYLIDRRCLVNGGVNSIGLAETGKKINKVFRRYVDAGV